MCVCVCVCICQLCGIYGLCEPCIKALSFFCMSAGGIKN
ncbi:hypothetical protein GLYMA_09G262750v4 [Glycine max]|nr:hypothetical protein GLYMA_09G262750v4 [Glycine max]